MLDCWFFGLDGENAEQTSTEIERDREKEREREGKEGGERERRALTLYNDREIAAIVQEWKKERKMDRGRR